MYFNMTSYTVYTLLTVTPDFFSIYQSVWRSPPVRGQRSRILPPGRHILPQSAAINFFSEIDELFVVVVVEITRISCNALFSSRRFENSPIICPSKDLIERKNVFIKKKHDFC